MAQPTLPPWIQELQRRDPKFVESYLSQREHVLKDGAIPGKYKILMTMVIDALLSHPTAWRRSPTAHGRPAPRRQRFRRQSRSRTFSAVRPPWSPRSTLSARHSRAAPLGRTVERRAQRRKRGERNEAGQRARLVAPAARGHPPRHVHPLSDTGHALPQLLLHRETEPTLRMGGRGQLPRHGRGPRVLAGARQQYLVRRRHHPRVDRPGHPHGGVGERQGGGARPPAPSVLHADRTAHDRGSEHLALLLHAGLWPPRPDHRPGRAA